MFEENETRVCAWGEGGGEACCSDQGGQVSIISGEYKSQP